MFNKINEVHIEYYIIFYKKTCLLSKTLFLDVTIIIVNYLLDNLYFFKLTKKENFF
jgi:hypothetical protein